MIPGSTCPMKRQIAWFRFRKRMIKGSGYAILLPSTILITRLKEQKVSSLAFSVVNQKGQELGDLGSTGTFEWGGYFNTQYFADPKEKIIGILMKQTQGNVTDNSGWKFRQLAGQLIDD
jgi:CubicO group peptidase (beta-lactamase class C family)